MFLVELAEIERADDVPAAIAQAVGVQLTDQDLAAAIAAALSRRELLVVLDNFEHLLAAPLLARLVAEAPDVRLLVTSQAALRLADEEVVAIDPLAVPERDDLEALAASPAAELLVERARRAVPGSSRLKRTLRRWRPLPRPRRIPIGAPAGRRALGGARPRVAARAPSELS